MFKKLLSIALCGAGVFYFAGSVASASERTIYSKSIPEMANANTIIQYEGNSLWKVVEDTPADIKELPCTTETPALSFNNAINTLETSKNTRQFSLSTASASCLYWNRPGILPKDAASSGICPTTGVTTVRESTLTLPYARVTGN